MVCLKILLAAILLNAVVAPPVEERLVKRLLKNYDKLVRPVKYDQSIVMISIQLMLQQILDVSERDQILKIISWVRTSWIDPRLAWNGTEDSKIVSYLVVPYELIWTPDIYLVNSIDSRFDSGFKPAVSLYSNGLIDWYPTGLYQVGCNLDVRYFPFDQQTCYFKFSSWSYHGLLLDVETPGFDPAAMLPNVEWILSNVSAERQVSYYTCCPEPYPAIFFNMTITRKTQYYYLNLFLPCTLATLLSISGFLLPPQSGEKTSLQVTVMLSIMVFMNLLTTMIPPTSEVVPLLGVYFTVCLLLVFSSVILTVLVLNIHHFDLKPIQSKFVRKLFLHYIPSILHMRTPVMSKFGLQDKKSIAMPVVGKKFSSMISSQPEVKGSTGWDKVANSLESIDTNLYQLNLYFWKAESEKDLNKEWHFVAKVIDRLCMCCLICVLVAVIIVMWFRAPHFN